MSSAALGPLLGGGVELAPAGSTIGASGGGAEESGADLEGEELVSFFFFFFGAVGAKGSIPPASSVLAPMLLAPVSSVSGGETWSSSAR
jgi:hypothetical protein